jgi:hypothetical protein
MVASTEEGVLFKGAIDVVVSGDDEDPVQFQTEQRSKSADEILGALVLFGLARERYITRDEDEIRRMCFVPSANVFEHL